MILPKHVALAVSGLLAAPSILAAEPVQKVKPPVSQAYIDLATFAGGAPMPGAGGVMGKLFGARDGGNSFGMTQAQSQGRWMDVTLLSRNNDKLKTATQTVPAGSKLAPVLNLLAPDPDPRVAQPEEAADIVTPKFDMPKGKMYLYWGCGAEVRKGQPLVLDLAAMNPAQLSKFFQNRTATARVPRPAPGRPAWPNRNDARLLPDGASLIGEHGFAGDGVVGDFRFDIGAQHDLMPAIEATRTDEGRGVLFKWKPMQQSTGWFVQSMGMRHPERAEGGEIEMVYWTSSEAPDMGMGLMDYQPDSAIRKWQKEKVVLPAAATECAAPKEAVGAMAMSRVIAYGDELNMAYPPRPKDVKVTWEPQWNIKVRRKSVASLMPGIGQMMSMAAAEQGDTQADSAAPGSAPAAAPAAGKSGGLGEAVGDAVKKTAVDSLVRGLFGR